MVPSVVPCAAANHSAWVRDASEVGAEACISSNAARRVNIQIPGALYFLQARRDFVVLQSRIRITKPAELPHPLKPLSNGADADELFPAATFDAHASEGAREPRWLEETRRLPADGLASQTSRA